MRLPALLLCAPACLLAFATAAHADCQSRLNEMAPRVAQVTEEIQRGLLDHDMKHARKELAEGDERDCKKILDHAASLLDQH
jgi:hypothetical protein